jgi:hypothetical protein
MVVSSDTANSRKFNVKSGWEPDEQYRILLKPGTIHDIYGRANDSTEIRFSTRDVDFYGRILLNFSSYVYPVILQVRSEKGSVVRSAVVKKAGVITFDYLPPGKYSFKAIHDVNGNGKWDTGDFIGKIQPEKTFISGNPQQLRSNWDWEPTWALTENSIDY